MKLTLARDPFTMMNRLQNAMNDEAFSIDWDDTQMDMYEEDDKVVVRLKAPGFDEKNIEVSLEDNTLTISGTEELREEEEDKNKKYYRKEIRTQSFSRSITLPSKVETEGINAQFKNGILQIEMPKAEEAKPKKININVG